VFLLAERSADVLNPEDLSRMAKCRGRYYRHQGRWRRLFLSFWSPCQETTPPPWPSSRSPHVSFRREEPWASIRLLRCGTS